MFLWFEFLKTFELSVFVPFSAIILGTKKDSLSSLQICLSCYMSLPSGQIDFKRINKLYNKLSTIMITNVFPPSYNVVCLSLSLRTTDQTLILCVTFLSYIVYLHLLRFVHIICNLVFQFGKTVFYFKYVMFLLFFSNRFFLDDNYQLDLFYFTTIVSFYISLIFLMGNCSSTIIVIFKNVSAFHVVTTFGSQ